jgi:hypothetical protein
MKYILLLALAMTASGAQAAPYPLGTMTCDDIGAFASEAMTWRKSAISHEEALVKLGEREFGDPVEKKNLTIILNFVYGNYGNNWTVESAGNVMRSDCRKGRDQ